MSPRKERQNKSRKKNLVTVARGRDACDQAGLVIQSFVVARLIDRLFGTSAGHLCLHGFRAEGEFENKFQVWTTGGNLQSALSDGRSASPIEGLRLLFLELSRRIRADEMAVVMLEIANESEFSSGPHTTGLFLRGGQLESCTHAVSGDAEKSLGFSPELVRNLLQDFVEFTESERPLLDEERFGEVVGVATIDGRDLFDVLAVVYGSEITIRLRYELTQRRDWLRPPVGMSLDTAMRRVVDALQQGWKLPLRPTTTTYSGNEAKKFVRQLFGASELDGTTTLGEVRIAFDAPEPHDNN